jgi:phage shock protein PspC (stress-responsive transcriptional regulator)
MKKIININLSGRVIPIEDSAYEKLQEYIESLRRYFAKEEGRDEIINDIESRIAELMNEKVRKGADCITDADVNEIAASMGRPEDFEAEEQEKQQSYSTFNQQSSAAATEAPPRTETKTKNRLYRDTSDKFIGGVCSGIAAYLNVDPAIVRILFAIITFGGFGLGFLAYIILWIVLPPRDIEGYSGKRLFRNPEHRMLGGVCSGLAAYFNKSISTIRFVFLAPIILNLIINAANGFSWDNDFNIFPNIVFGSLTSTFVVAYIILWIVLPEARSPYEKMEMRGEKVDVNTIKQTVQDRAKDFSEDVKSAAQNISNKAKEFAKSPETEKFTREIKDTGRRVGSGIGHAIGVLFKVFFLFIAGSIAFGLFVGLMAIIFGGLAWWPVNNFLWTSNWQQAYAWGTIILFLGVPLIGFLVWLIRRIIGVKSRSNYLSWIFGGLWTLGWVSVILLVSSLVRDTRTYKEISTEISITQPANKMTVIVTEPPLEFTDRFWWVDSDSEGWNLTEDTLKLSLVDFTIEKSFDANYHVYVVRKSAGKTESDAISRAERIQYRVSGKDSLLDLANGFAIDKDSKYRGQIVELKILVPEDKKIRFDESITHKLNPVEIKVRDRSRRLRRARIDIDVEDWFQYRTGVDYTMSKDGELVDPSRPASSKPATSTSSDYRYEQEQKQLNSVEEQRKKVEEEQRKLRELEESQKKQIIKDSVKKESIEDEEGSMEVAGSPVFSLLKIFY